VISSFEKQIMISGSRHAPAGLPRPVSPDVVMSEDGAVSWETHHYIAANINHTNRMLKHYYQPSQLHHFYEAEATRTGHMKGESTCRREQHHNW
jgi:hypothetical protein